jgi:hypothetical protein
MFLAKLVISIILCFIWPSLDPIAMLTIFFPLSDVPGSVQVLVSAFALGFVVYPVAFVDVTVRMDETTLAITLVVLPVAHILAAVCPYLGAFTFSEAITGPLPEINCSII